MPYKPRISPFSVITVFTLLVIIGLSIMPLLQVNLEPSRGLPSVTVGYSMRGATGELIDAEVTTPIEGALSTVSGVKQMISNTGKGSGSVRLQMDKKSDMDAVRFEVSMLIRRLYPQLPEGCSMPTVSINKPDEENRVETLLSFHVNGPGSKTDIISMLNREVVPNLSAIKGVHEVNCSGAERRRLAFAYSPEELKAAGFTGQDIKTAVQNHYRFNKHAGFAMSGSNKTPVVLSGNQRDTLNIENIFLNNGSHSERLSNLVNVQYTTRKANRYFRINGLNAVYLTVTAAKGVNTLETGKKVKEALLGLQEALPGYTFLTAYDATVYLKDELGNIALRIALSVCLLLIFILVISRSWRYLFICFTGIFTSIVLAFIFYVLLNVEIHLYSLAGITLSLGIIIDNIIVMTDHLRHRGNMKAYLAILASTLTTIGALLVIFFLDEHEKLRLLDFAWVIIINLTVSLAVSLFLIPALLQKLPIRKRITRLSLRRKRRIIKLTVLYERIIAYTYKKRAFFIILAILVFGLPVHKLPVTVDGDGFWAEVYNNTLGSNFFSSHLKKPAEFLLGGVFRPFNTRPGALSNSTVSRTRLNIAGSMPFGATLEQANLVIGKVENFLAQYNEIDRFQTSVYSPQSANISVWFKDEHELGYFPFILKEEVQSYCIDIGGIDWTIAGVGRGFDNSLREGYRNSRLVLYGYNLEMLKKYAWQLRDSLQSIQRVEKIFVNGRETNSDKIAYEQYLQLNTNALMGQNINRGRILNKLGEDSEEELLLTYTSTKSGEPVEVVLVKSGFIYNDKWEFNHKPVELNEGQSVKISQIGNISKQRVSDLINKENMEYKLVVEFDFIGSYGQKEILVGEMAKRFNQDLPIGFRIETHRYFGSSWLKDKDKDNRIFLILLIAAIIYMICAVLLESLLQPLAIIAMIPLTFIGVFLVFWLFNLPFGDGGYASLLLLSGLTVNSALYILNDFNNLKKEQPRIKGASPYKIQIPMPLESYKSKSRFKRALISCRQKGVRPGYTRYYLVAYNHKIVPILLTIFSTVLGFVPFLMGGKQDPFWFSLAAGTMGGLVFSVLALYIYLPLFLRLNRKKFLLNERQTLKVSDEY